MRVLVGGIFHETNTFLRGTAAREEFEEFAGEDLLGLRGEGSPIAGVLAEAERSGWTVLPALYLRATPGPTVADAVVEHFVAQLETAIKREMANRLDGVLLVLHGAMVSESCQDVEGLILARVREKVGPEVPLGAVLDLHGNCTPEMAGAAHLLLAYRENPHIDGEECGTRAAQLMHRILAEKLRTRCVLRNVPVLWPPTGTATASDPMAQLEKMARATEESEPNILAMNVLAGFAFSDVHWAGVSFCCVTAGAPEPAERLLDSLAEAAFRMRQTGNRVEQNLDDALGEILTKRGGPYLLIEPADNIGAGTSGRGLGVLKALLARRVVNAAVAIYAPEQVAALAAAPLGTKVCCRLTDDFAEEILELSGELASRSDGRFTLEDPHSHLASMGGRLIDMGPCAVLRAGGVRVLLTSERTPPFDLGQFRSQGIEPESLFVVGIKAAVAHRRAWDPIAAGSYWVDVRGPCSSNLRSLPYQRLRRPIYPLDPL